MYKKINLDKLIIYDIETICNCFIVCFKDYKTQKKKEFVIFDSKKYDNSVVELFNFIKTCIKHNYTFVGFNNLGFDAQVLTYFYEWCCEKRDPLINFTNDFVVEKIYQKAQKLISIQDSLEKFKYLNKEEDLFSPQIDLFKQHHYDRPQKATSLKWVQFSMNYPTIEEMPIPHDRPVEENQIPMILEYCWNDVDSTMTFFEKAKFETDVRLQLSKEYKLNLVNASEPKMVREIFGKFLCQEMGINYTELKKLKTERESVKLNEVIFPYVQFQTKEFKEVLDIFKSHTVVTDLNYEFKDNTIPAFDKKGNPLIDKKTGKQKNKKIKVKEDNDISLNELRKEHGLDWLERDRSKFNYTFNFKGMEVVLGLGGIHACVEPGVYVPGENEIIEDADGTSFYPFLAIKNDLRPEHLGKAFNVVYPLMFEERMKYPKKDPRNYVFKIILNSAYGLSKEVNSYLYDPKFTYGITINGQLSLLMLAEALSMSVPNIKFLQMNTDGITYVYNKDYEAIVRKICSWWEKTTKIGLEYAYYDKMVIMDVNNYLAVKSGFDDTKDEKEYIKKKGLFETEKPFHKNPSSLIIPKALEKYFIKNLTPKDFIISKEHSIFDFCNGVKKKNNFDLNLLINVGDVEVKHPQQKITRYIITNNINNSGLLVKDFHDGRRVSVEAEKFVIPLNNIEDTSIDKYPINFEHYINETEKVINLIEEKE